MANGIKLYEQLLTFSVYRQENDNELQQALYTDLTDILKRNPPNTDEEAVAHIYAVLSTILKFASTVPSTNDNYDQLHEEMRELLAMTAHYLIEE